MQQINLITGIMFLLAVFLVVLFIYHGVGESGKSPLKTLDLQTECLKIVKDDPTCNNFNWNEMKDACEKEGYMNIEDCKKACNCVI